VGTGMTIIYEGILYTYVGVLYKIFPFQLSETLLQQNVEIMPNNLKKCDFIFEEEIMDTN
jgi:hypothetical protein